MIKTMITIINDREAMVNSKEIKYYNNNNNNNNRRSHGL